MADSAAATRAKTASAARIAGRAPVVDGRLDDAAWGAAPVITGFWQKEPKEGMPATERTEVRVLYDDRALYVGARMLSSDPARIRAPVSRRDATEAAEFIAVSLDTYHDRRTAYTFAVTAAGTRGDVYHPRDSDDGDTAFDPVWEAKVARDSAGWTAEMRIPLSQLRFTPGESQTWGMNLRRWIPQKEEDDYWVLVPKSVSAWASRFGELGGITGIHPERRVELSPYVATGASFSQGVDTADPFHSPREETVRTGADVKVGLGSNLTLDATVNPDFGQVEADPAEVNLSAFETFFSEKRPFFIEGSDLLSGGGAQYFYSRRIGAAPHGPAIADFVDRPSNTTILGAAKLTGRLPTGLSVGVLGAATAREVARTFDATAGTFGRVEVEPPAGYGVVRLQQELGKSGSTAGIILTGVHRDVAGDSPLAAVLDRDALAGAADWDLRLGKGTYEVSGSVGFSHVAGDSLAIRRLQRSSARYLQRPDADYVTYDPSRTTLSGYTATFAAQKISGRHWLWTAGAEMRSPGFELNDAGAMSSADYRTLYGELRYRETTPRGALRKWAVFLTPQMQWNGGGVMTDQELWLDGQVTWKNFWRSSFTAFRIFPAQSQTLTRGGPLAGTQGSTAVIGLLQNSASATFQWRGRIYYGMADDHAVTERLSGGISVRPGPRWQLSVEPNFLRYTPTRQYVATFDDGPAATFGRSYVFAAMQRSELFADLRLTYLFTPDLSLEVYAEPFASSGRYHDFGELPAAGAHELRALDGDTTRVVRHGSSTEVRLGAQSRTVDDFNVRSFRSNAVLRWEWRPGSTLYLVWQQDRSGDRTRIAPVAPRSLLETLDTPGDNFLALKVTYWLPLH
ncbi:MAG: carbohydrate binding family 9 domain-containing protein [Gemmatimonadetes bacterium]|nr:carbohydrate binding family 9 domain-containing protein [Gemmatimonadota bacterium]